MRGRTVPCIRDELVTGQQYAPGPRSGHRSRRARMANKSKSKEGKHLRPAQTQDRRPGLQTRMKPRPKSENAAPECGSKFRDRVALITGGDSGIGRAMAISFAKEGADVAVVYLDEDRDARKTKALVEKHGMRCLLLRGDIAEPAFCREVVDETVRELGRLDILLNNAGEQHPQESIEKITPEQLERTFRTNIFSMFYLTSAATKGAIVAFTRSLAGNLAKRGVRVNAVAPARCGRPSSVDVQGEEGCRVRFRRAARARGRARGDRAELRVSRFGRRLLHDGAGPSPERRGDHQWMMRPAREVRMLRRRRRSGA